MIHKNGVIINELGIYEFTIIPKEYLEANSRFRITVPNEMEVKSDCNIISGCGTCNYINSQAFEVTGCMTTTYFSHNCSDIQFVVENIYNPSASSIVNTFEIESLISSEAVYNPAISTHKSSATPPAIIFTENILQDVSITPSSNKAIEMSNYTINFRVDARVVSGSTIRVLFPDQITPTETCLELNANLDPITCSISGHWALLVDGFLAHLPSTNYIKFKIEAENARKSGIATSQFQIIINTTYGITHKFEGIDSVLQIHYLPRMIIDQASPMNGVNNKCIFGITIPYPLIIGDYIKLRSPTQSNCIRSTLSEESGIGPPLSTVKITSGSYIYYRFYVGGPVPAGDIKIKMNCTNPLTLSTSHIVCDIYSNIGYIMYTFDFLSTTIPSEDLISTITMDPSLCVQSSKYIFEITRQPAYPNPSLSYMVLELPTSGTIFTLADLICTDIQGITAFSCSTDWATKPNKINISISINQPNFKFQVEGFTNPAISVPSTSFKLSTYNTLDQIMEEVEIGLIIRSDCNFPCKSCESDRTSCKTCFEPSYGYSEIYLHINPMECIISCPLTSLTYTNLSCEDCNSPCNSCTLDLDHCTTCIPGKVLQGTLCLDSCYSKYYLNISNNVCTPCMEYCKNCEYEHPTLCTECPDKNYGDHLLNPEDFLCYSECPMGMYQDSLTTCARCTSNLCETCTSSEACTSCIYGYELNKEQECVKICSNNLLYSPKLLQCVEECGPHEYISEYNSALTCKECNTKCLTCSQASKCTSCPPTLVLDNGHCNSLCHFGLFLNESNMICSPCFHPCLTCYQSSTFCLDCKSGYVFYENECMKKCPDYHSTKRNAQDCRMDINAATYIAAAFIILTLGIYVFAGVRKFKYKDEGIIDGIIWQTQVLEYVCVISQMGLLMFQESSLNLIGSTLFSAYFMTFLGINIMNTAFAVAYIKIQDPNFKIWKTANPTKFNLFIGGIFSFSFQISRLHSTKLLGNSKLQCEFTDSENINRPISLFSRISAMGIAPLLCVNILWIATKSPDIKLYFLQSQQTALFISNIGLIIYDEIKRINELKKAKEEMQKLETEAALRLEESSEFESESESSHGSSDNNVKGEKSELRVGEESVNDLVGVDTNTSMDMLTLGTLNKDPGGPLSRHRKLAFNTKTNIKGGTSIYIYSWT